MAGLMKKMMDNNYAPGWFYLDRQKGVSNDDIISKLKLELHNHAVNSNYNLSLWTDTFVAEVASMYYAHFDKLYNMSVQAQQKSMELRAATA